jgi:hypothetical protein
MSIPDKIRRRVAEAFHHQCAYCRMPRRLIYAPVEVEHIKPKARGGTDEEDNLCLSCSLCNGHKSTKISAVDPSSGVEVALYHPRRQKWSDHFHWDETDHAKIVGLTSCGRATIEALKMNEEDTLAFRQLMVAMGRYPPTD